MDESRVRADVLEYYITYDDGEFIRIEDEDGCSVSIRVTSTDFFIVSILVEEELRLKGRGRGLLAAAEYEAYARKKSGLSALYVDNEGIGAFFKKCQFSPVDGSSITAFDVKTMVRIKRVRQMMSRIPEEHRYVNLRGLDISGFEKLMTFLGSMGLSTVINRVSDMDLDISGILMVRGVMVAALLCARIGEDVYLDSAACSEAGDKSIIATAFIGMLEAAVTSGVRHIITAEPEGLSKKVIEFITDGYTGEESSRWVVAEKRTRKSGHGEIEKSIHRDIQPELKNEWQRELRHLPVQRGMSERTVV